MIFHGRKSDEKCYVEELARFAAVIKEFCVLDGCVVVWYSKVKLCFAFFDHNIYCHCLLSLAVRYSIITYSTIKSLRKIVEVTCCHIKIKRNLMVALLLILRDCRVAINTLFKHFLRSDRPQWSSACTKSQLSYVPSEIFNLKRNGGGIYISKFATFVSKFFEPGGKLLRANCQSKYQLRRKFAKLRGKEHPVWL